MTAYFLDSSALVKRYVSEAGTDWIRDRTDPTAGAIAFITQITMVEILSGLARKMREGTIAPTELRALRDVLAHHTTTRYSIVLLDDAILAGAQELLLNHPLRAYDAIQLASAISITTRLHAAQRAAPTFISADKRLLAAATAEGLAIDDPNDHP